MITDTLTSNELKNPNLAALRVNTTPPIRTLIQQTANTLNITRDELIHIAMKDFIIRASNNNTIALDTDIVINTFFPPQIDNIEVISP